MVYPTAAFGIARDCVINGARLTGDKKRKNTKKKTKTKKPSSSVVHKIRFQMDERLKYDKAKLEIFRKNSRILLYWGRVFKHKRINHKGKDKKY